MEIHRFENGWGVIVDEADKCYLVVFNPDNPDDYVIEEEIPLPVGGACEEVRALAPADLSDWETANEIVSWDDFLNGYIPLQEEEENV